MNNHNLDLKKEIILANPYNRDFIFDKLNRLRLESNLYTALVTLFRQQVEAGFVLSDPLKDELKEKKHFFDKVTGVNFTVEWNPNRELRKNHALLIERGVVNDNIDQSDLINRDNHGKACYLCSQNIKLQNPLEILFPIELSGTEYFCGANFAPITDNHFTLMTSEHLPQNYDSNVIKAMIDFVQKTDGNFRAIFNGRAGASILSHLHLQGTTEKMPVEGIILEEESVILNSRDIRVYNPFYYIPLFILESESVELIQNKADQVIRTWISLDYNLHTLNILVLRENEVYKIFIFLRDRNKLIGDGKEGDMGTFECAGNLVLSYGIFNSNQDVNNEKLLFENFNFDLLKNLLNQISPDNDFNLSKLLVKSL